MSRPPALLAFKIADARKHSSFRMAFTITDRRVKGAPILIFRRTSYRLSRLAATAFRTCRMRIPGLFLALCAMTPANAAPAAHAPADPVREAAELSIKRLKLQVSMPHTPTKLDNVSSWNPHLPGWLIYVAAAIAVAIIAYIVLEMIPGRRARNDEDWATTGDGFPGATAPAEITLAQADDLAARGFFVEAMHLLLLHSLAEIRRRLRLEFADSLTSREILRRARLPEEVTGALRSIVTRVELSYFGGYPAAQPDYESCRAGFEALSSVLAKGNPTAVGAAG